MAQSRMYPLADRALGGDLEQRLRSARDRGDSFERISRDLYTEGIPVSGETIRTWCRELGIETERAS